MSRNLADIPRQIDDIAFSLYGIDGEDRRMMEASAGAVSPAGEDEGESEEEP